MPFALIRPAPRAPQPAPINSQISSSKPQINFKSQKSMTETLTEAVFQSFRILNLNYWSLFGICYLVLGIFSASPRSMHLTLCALLRAPRGRSLLLYALTFFLRFIQSKIRNPKSAIERPRNPHPATCNPAASPIKSQISSTKSQINLKYQ
jgi:hypothetical protein